MLRAAVTGLVLSAALALSACSAGGGDAQPALSSSPAASAGDTAVPLAESSARGDEQPSSRPSGAPSSAGPSDGVPLQAGPPPTSGPVRLERWFDRELTGGGLRLGRERERTGSYISYDVRYRSEGLRITGVVDVPRGRGPFPAVVLAHGYIDPAVYVRGQGMPRERRYLAAAGYIALHVDYRNHAGSDDDPALDRTFRLGYSVDVLNAVNALRATEELPSTTTA